MSCNSDLDVRRREISALVDGVVAASRPSLPPVEGLYDDDLSEAMDIINRIERRMRANQQHEAAE